MTILLIGLIIDIIISIGVGILIGFIIITMNEILIEMPFGSKKEMDMMIEELES